MKGELWKRYLKKKEEGLSDAREKNRYDGGRTLWAHGEHGVVVLGRSDKIQEQTFR